jgi:hypothetical protein
MNGNSSMQKRLPKKPFYKPFCFTNMKTFRVDASSTTSRQAYLSSTPISASSTLRY